MLAALVTWLVGAASASASAADAETAAISLELQVKAACLFNFAKFVDWPAEPGADAAAPLRICIWGEDPFEGNLEQIVSGKLAGGRPIEVSHPQRALEVPACHIFYVAAGQERGLDEVLPGLRDRPVLTVGESEEFHHAGGILRFWTDNNKVRFAIDPDAATRARLKISSHLMSLAKPPPGREANGEN